MLCQDLQVFLEVYGAEYPLVMKFLPIRHVLTLRNSKVCGFGFGLAGIHRGLLDHAPSKSHRIKLRTRRIYMMWDQRLYVRSARKRMSCLHTTVCAAGSASAACCRTTYCLASQPDPLVSHADAVVQNTTGASKSEKHRLGLRRLE